MTTVYNSTMYFRVFSHHEMIIEMILHFLLIHSLQDIDNHMPSNLFKKKKKIKNNLEIMLLKNSLKRLALWEPTGGSVNRNLQWSKIF